MCSCRAVSAASRRASALISWERCGTGRPRFVVVEPDKADCLYRSAVAGKPTPAEGALDTIMAGLACGEVSILAWQILETGADAFMTIDDEAAADCMRVLADGRFGDAAVVAGESAVAGLAGLLLASTDANARRALDLRPDSRVLVFGSEGATDPDVYRTIVGRSPERGHAAAECMMSNTSALAETVCRDIDAAREELIDLCGRLVAAASVNPPGRTAEVADVVRGYLSSHGIAHETVKADDEAPNVVACIQGGAGGRHVVFNAHMDTMEAGDESAWSVPIMRLTRRDGRLYGLGMGNMKGALAAMCLATAILNRHGNAWRGRLTMTAVSDEVMFGERGTVFLLRERPDLGGRFSHQRRRAGLHGLCGRRKGLAVARRGSPRAAAATPRGL